MITTTAPVAAPPRSTGRAVARDHLSWSSIECYTQCPKRFCYRYVEQAPPESVPASLVFGSAFHALHDRIQQARLEGDGVPEPEELLQVFDEEWESETRDAPQVLYAKGDDAGSMRELAARMVAAYLTHLQSLPGPAGQILAIEHAERFQLLRDVPPIEMRLDLLELRGDDLLVTDVKTSKSAWNEAKVREHLPQLVLYAHGCTRILREFEAKRIVPRFLVVTKAKSPKVQVFEPRPTRDDVARLKHHVADVWAAIRAGVFITHEGWICSQCPYRGRCLGS
jgi:hypothetical protein